MELPEDIEIPEEVLKKLQDPELIKTMMSSGKSLQELLGYSTEVMESMYAKAYALFEEKEWRGANQLFLFLSTLDPYTYGYWLGLAMTYQMLEDYEQAILAYECSLTVNPEAYIGYYHMASCHALLNEVDDALRLLELLEKRCENKPELDWLYQKAKVAYQKLHAR